MLNSAIVLLGIQFVSTALLCVFLVRYLAAKEISWDVKLTCYVSWVLGFSGVVLLPYDISTVLGSTADDRDNASSLVRGWGVIYWSTFVLAWIILPLQLEFHNSGYFSFKDRVRDVRTSACAVRCGVLCSFTCMHLKV